MTLEHGDIIQVGKHTFSFAESAFKVAFANDEEMEVKPVISDANALPAVDPDSVPSDAGWLQILNGSHLGRIIPLSSKLTRLGKTGKDCAIIAHRSDGYYLSHLAGKHTPMVGDESIGEKSYRLQDGDIVDVGSIRVLFSSGMEE
jgi:hypothetical protein